MEDKMIEVETIKIDDVDYIILKQKKIGDNEYFFLTDINNPKNYLLAKTEIIDGEEYIAEIIDKEESEKVANIFIEEIK